MKRAGFTMIELIFVIVILGILAAVALPKFIGISDQANAAKCEAWVGTLNRTIGASMWSESIAESNGTVNQTGISVPDHVELNQIPVQCYGATAAPADDAAAKAMVFDTNYHVTFGNSQYDINFTDGNASSAPRWTWTKTN